MIAPHFSLVKSQFSYSDVYLQKKQMKKVLQFHPYDYKTQKYMSDNGYKAIFEVHLA